MMQESIVLEFEPTDQELIDEVKSHFGNDVTLTNLKNFDGLQVVQVILPVVPALVQLLLAHLANKKSKRKRLVVTPNGKITLENYTMQEIEDFLRRP